MTTSPRRHQQSCTNMRPIIVNGFNITNKQKMYPLKSTLSLASIATHQQQQQLDTQKKEQLDICHRLMGRLGLSLPLLKSGASANAQLTWCRQLLEACDQFRRDRDQLSVRLQQSDRQLAEIRRQLTAIQKQKWSSSFSKKTEQLHSPPQRDVHPTSTKKLQPREPAQLNWESRYSLSVRPTQIPRQASGSSSGSLTNSVTSSLSTNSMAERAAKVRKVFNGASILSSTQSTMQTQTLRKSQNIPKSANRGFSLLSNAGNSTVKLHQQIFEEEQHRQWKPVKQQRQPMQGTRTSRRKSRDTVDLDVESVRRHWRSRTFDKSEANGNDFS